MPLKNHQEKFAAHVVFTLPEDSSDDQMGVVRAFGAVTPLP